ncbi:MAG: hypothetical protein ACREX9_16155 [Gammaproteobacteria bacterium]
MLTLLKASFRLAKVPPRQFVRRPKPFLVVSANRAIILYNNMIIDLSASAGTFVQQPLDVGRLRRHRALTQNIERVPKPKKNSTATNDDGATVGYEAGGSPR